MFYVKNGFPNQKSDMESFTKDFWNFRLNIIIKSDLLYYGDRLIVPDYLRKEVLKKLHGAHQGTRGMELRASHIFFWPNISEDIKIIRDNCLSCNESQP